MTINSVFRTAAVLLVTAISYSTSIGAVNNTSCFTPNGERALCIFLEQCTFMKNLLERKPLRSEDVQYLRRSQCGYENGQVYVCCPDRYRSPQATPVNISTRIRGSLPEPDKCGNTISNRIYGGNQTHIDEYPWMALIEYSRDGSSIGHHCGGSLINERYILTAAHCLVDVPKQWTPFRVRLGEWDISTDRDCVKFVTGYEDCAPDHVDFDIEKLIPHENYVATSSNKLHDIALIRLASIVSYSDFIQPICLPFKDSLRSVTFEGIAMDISGWGSTENGQLSNIKLKASVAVVPLRDCQAVYAESVGSLKDSQMCAGGQAGVDSCRGDSGGPLIGWDTSDKTRGYHFIAGIVSFGPTPCGLQGWPGGYTKVSAYISWIQDNIQP